MDDLLSTLQDFPHLLHLKIEMEEGCKLLCKPEVWENIQDGLKHPHVLVYTSHKDLFLELIWKVPNPFLEEHLVEDLLNVANQFQLIERLAMLQEDCTWHQFMQGNHERTTAGWQTLGKIMCLVGVCWLVSQA